MENKFTLHLNPIWREKANFIINYELGVDPDKPNVIQMEQLWAKRLEENRFMVCCIPFFAYGIALGDEVLTAPKGKMNFIVQSVVQPSGHSTFRVWLGDTNQELVPTLLKLIRQTDASIEFYSEHLFGVDSSSEEITIQLLQILKKWQADGNISYEAGNSSS